ncbi:hypothetical protein LTR95_000483 [Oleoguttula sp. CCFEE 5521]
MAAPLLRQRLVPLVGLTAGMALIPRRTAYAEEPPTDSLAALRRRRPIYDTPSSASIREIAATTPAPASGLTSTPQKEAAAASPTRGPSPTDRLAAQIARSRLFLHRYASSAEQSVNNGLTRVLSAEDSLATTVRSLAPPKESNEKLLPGGIYVLVAAMAGSIVSRNRNIALRFITPIITGVVTANYVIPRTTENVGNLIWKYESRFPVVRDQHLRIRDGVTHFWETGKAHSQMGLAMAEDKVEGVVESVQAWVKQGR